jgi:hypothetical protein
VRSGFSHHEKRLSPQEGLGGTASERPCAQQPLLDGASLPEHLDVFRLRNCHGFIVRLGFEEFSLRELPVR